MKITKTKRIVPPPPPVFILQDPPKRRAHTVLIIVLAIALILSLTRCASLPTDVATLQEQNARLRTQLEEAEADLGQCLNYLTECESLCAE